MIAGVVNANLEATLVVRVICPDGTFRDVQAVIDTGYNGDITLPMSIVSALSLPKGAARSVILGDTTTKVFDYCTAEVMWDGRSKRVRVLCVQGDPLIGTALLSGYKLEADFEPGGSVTLRRPT